MQRKRNNIPRDQRRLWNTQDITDYLGIGKKQAYKLMHEADFPRVRLASQPSSLFTTKEALDKYIEDHMIV